VVDPQGTLFKFRLYRQHCICTQDGIYIKDLSFIKSHTLADILLVDNSVCSFGIQLDNGIPIVPFYHDAEDQELVHLASYALTIASKKDMVSVNRDTFKLRKLLSSDLSRFLQEDSCDSSLSSLQTVRQVSLRPQID
jgi:CTD small phosphatase-like protein 2